MDRRFGTQKIKGFIRLSLMFLLVLGCAGMFPETKRGEIITKPDKAYVSPNMDFGKIAGLGVCPTFPGNVESTDFADSFNGALISELQARQSQWKIIPTGELVSLINQHGLGRGYKNLQADLNTYGTEGFGVMTAETKEFLKELGKKVGVNSYLLSTYKLSSFPTITQTLFGPLRVTANKYEVVMILYQVDQGVMWAATHTVTSTSSDISAEASNLAKVFGANIGKGSLRQL